MKLRNGQHRYTAEEDAWLQDNYEKYTHPELNRIFNERFGTNLKSGVSDHVLKTLHLHKSANPGNCKKGERRCTNMLPIGSESFDGQNMYVKMIYFLTCTPTCVDLSSKIGDTFLIIYFSNSFEHFFN